MAGHDSMSLSVTLAPPMVCPLAGRLVSLQGTVADVLAFHAGKGRQHGEHDARGSCEPLSSPVRNSRPTSCAFSSSASVARSVPRGRAACARGRRGQSPKRSPAICVLTSTPVELPRRRHVGQSEDDLGGPARGQPLRPIRQRATSAWFRGTGRATRATSGPAASTRTSPSSTPTMTSTTPSTPPTATSTATAPAPSTGSPAGRRDPRPSNWCHAQQRPNSIRGVQKGRLGIACCGALRLPVGRCLRWGLGGVENRRS
jgi:hypothetical protein